MGCIRSCAQQSQLFFKQEASGVSKRVCFCHSQAFAVDWDPKPSELDLPVDFLEHSKCRNSSFLRSRYQVCGAKHGIETKAVTMSINPWTGRLHLPLRFTIVPKDGEKARLELQEGVVCMVLFMCYCVVSRFCQFIILFYCDFRKKKHQHFCLRGATPPGRASRSGPEVQRGQSGRLGRQSTSVCLAAGERGGAEEPPRIG